MVRFSLAAVLAVTALQQSSAFLQAGPAARVPSRRPAVAVEQQSDVTLKIPTPQAPKPGEEEQNGAMMDLSGVVLSVSSFGVPHCSTSSHFVSHHLIFTTLFLFAGSERTSIVMAQ